jgi:hypothetical protein
MALNPQPLPPGIYAPKLSRSVGGPQVEMRKAGGEHFKMTTRGRR